jgi:hypothetical protein
MNCTCMEGNDCRLIYPEKLLKKKSNRENPKNASQCPGVYMNRTIPECKSEALPSKQASSVSDAALLTLKTLLYEGTNRIKPQRKNVNSNKKCITFWLLIHSLPSNRSSSVDAATLEITICDNYKTFRNLHTVQITTATLCLRNLLCRHCLSEL